MSSNLSRREFLHSLGLLAVAAGTGNSALASASVLLPRPQEEFLQEFGYGQVQLAPGLAETQFRHTLDVIMGLDEDSMLKPLRQRANMPAPGADLGGWYDNFDGCDMFHDIERGFAPAHCLGQWMSGLARAYAITGSQPAKDKLTRLIAGCNQVPLEKHFKDLRYPAYTYDKFVCALSDAYVLADYKNGLIDLNRVTEKIVPLLPEKAMDHNEMEKRPHIDLSYCWDESYTMPENLFIAYERGAGSQYLELAKRYLKDDTYFDPLSQGKNVLPDHHAYSYMNALSSAAKAYMTIGSEKHLKAAKNAFEMIQTTQSFATGGWGPNESFVEPGKGALAKSLTDTHKSFETPCGAYAHFKLTRYLLRVTRDPKYGDSMERVFYNTILGAKPLLADGRGFYYADYNYDGQKYYRYAWNCCTGTLPQITADYRISAYFHAPKNLYVNLYLPSTLHFESNGTKIALTQESNYPLDGNIKFKLALSRPVEYTLHFRIPAWTASEGGKLRINGKSEPGPLVAGTFAPVTRKWKDGDVIELELPLPLRLEAIDDKNPDIVALVRGPLVLFSIVDGKPTVSRQQLLAAERSAPAEWKATHSKGTFALLPYTAIDKEHYSTYLQVV